MKFLLSALFVVSYSTVSFAEETQPASGVTESKITQTTSNCPCSHGYLDSSVPPIVVGPATAGPTHVRYPYYSYRRPWYTPGQQSFNVTIVW